MNRTLRYYRCTYVCAKLRTIYLNLIQHFPQIKDNLSTNVLSNIGKLQNEYFLFRYIMHRMINVMKRELFNYCLLSLRKSKRQFNSFTISLINQRSIKQHIPKYAQYKFIGKERFACLNNCTLQIFLLL